VRILVWFIAAGALWIAGGLADGPLRTVLWLAALAIDLIGPLITFPVPGLERMGPEAWIVGSEHFAERFQLFVIIALGESIVITGTTTSGLALDAATVTAFVFAFLGTAALWWLYFAAVAEHAHRALEDAERRTVIARDVYTYLHVLVIAGIVVTAVGDELVIVHPNESLATPEVVAVVAGPVIYLLAQMAIRLRMARTISPRRLAGTVGCVAVGVALSGADAVVLAGGVLAVLVALVIADVLSHRRRGAVAQVLHPAETS